MTFSNSILIWTTVTSRWEVVFGLQRWQAITRQFPCWFGMAYEFEKYWCCDLCILLVLLVVLSEAIRNSPSWTYHWNSIKEVGKMIHSASFKHCVSITLMGSSEVPKNKQHMSTETLLWSSAGKSFALSLLAVLAVSLAVCFPAADNIQLHLFSSLCSHWDDFGYTFTWCTNC